jgi:hypothetical protein
MFSSKNNTQKQRSEQLPSTNPEEILQQHRQKKQNQKETKRN